MMSKREGSVEPCLDAIFNVEQEHRLLLALRENLTPTSCFLATFSCVWLDVIIREADFLSDSLQARIFSIRERIALL
jgi:hypothetical protein